MDNSHDQQPSPSSSRAIVSPQADESRIAEIRARIEAVETRGGTSGVRLKIETSDLSDLFDDAHCTNGNGWGPAWPDMLEHAPEDCKWLLSLLTSLQEAHDRLQAEDEAVRVLLAVMSGNDPQQARIYDPVAMAKQILQRAEKAEAALLLCQQEREWAAIGIRAIACRVRLSGWGSDADALNLWADRLSATLGKATTPTCDGFSICKQLAALQHGIDQIVQEMQRFSGGPLALDHRIVLEWADQLAHLASSATQTDETTP